MFTPSAPSTRPDGLDGLLGKFPESLEALVLGKVDEDGDPEKREAAVSDTRVTRVTLGLRLGNVGVTLG